MPPQLGAEPLREEHAYPAQPQDAYGWEKLITERLCIHYREDYGIETRIVRFHNIFGPLGSWTGGVLARRLRGSRHTLRAYAIAELVIGLSAVVVPLGLGSLVLARPAILAALHWGGAAVLLWLSWKIATATSDSRTDATSERGTTVGYLGAAVFQWVNPKSWLVAASAAGTFLSADAGSPLGQAAMLGGLFAGAALPSGFVWLAGGAALQHVLHSQRQRRLFNVAMGALLALSCAATGATLLGYWGAPSFQVMVALAVVSGLARGIDTAAQPIVAHHHRTAHRDLAEAHASLVGRSHDVPTGRRERILVDGRHRRADVADAVASTVNIELLLSISPLKPI